jgi:putative Mg2+ transporter-C (MgtC) family protein
LGLALVLSSAIGVEREMRQKTAGLRTYTLVGVGSAVFTLVSIFGFSDLIGQRSVSLDPSRVAAQIVSGIGFIGGGIIFVRRDTVRGLTTAAGVWVTAGVGMACGGDMPIVAVTTTVVYFVVAYAYPVLVSRLPRSRDAPSELRLVYLDGQGILREALAECARRGFSISDLSIKHNGALGTNGHKQAVVTVELEVRGRGPVAELASELNEMDGIVDVHADDMNVLSTSY